MKYGICKECLLNREWYAYWHAEIGRLFIRRQTTSLEGKDEYAQYDTCVLDTRKSNVDELYFDDMKSLKDIVPKVKKIPRECERYCQHIMVGNA